MRPVSGLQLDKALGEQRLTNYHGVGMSVGPEVDFSTICQGIDDRKQVNAKLRKEPGSSLGCLAALGRSLAGTTAVRDQERV